ncbi:MAG: HAD family hydrolase [Holdemanella porci]
MSLELCHFDVDGLLLNTERVWQDVWCDVAESYGISEWTQESFLHVVGRTGIAVREFAQYCFTRKMLSQEEFLDTARQTGLKRLESQLEVKTGVYEILDYIKMTGIRCAVTTYYQ